MISFIAYHDAVNVNTLILIAVVVGYAIKVVGEGRGWFRHAAKLREENVDLLRRNEELMDDRKRLEEKVATLDEKVIRLEEQVKTLQKLDQTAVLLAIKQHETEANVRYQGTHTVLERIADALEHAITPTGGGHATDS